MTPPTDGQRRPYQRLRTEQLTVDAIVEASLEIIEELGFDALSMRVLGERLSVSHMAIYHHVSGKRALQELVADAVLARVVQPGAEVEDWADRLLVAMASFRAELLRYNGLADFVIHEQQVTEAARPLHEYAITTLLEAGFDPARAALGREAIFALVPYALPRTAAGRGVAPRKRRGRSRWAPEVQEALDAAAEIDALERWTFATRCVLEGLRAQRETGRARPAATRPGTRKAAGAGQAATGARKAAGVRKAAGAGKAPAQRTATKAAPTKAAAPAKAPAAAKKATAKKATAAGGSSRRRRA